MRCHVIPKRRFNPVPSHDVIELIPISEDVIELIPKSCQLPRAPHTSAREVTPRGERGRALASWRARVAAQLFSRLVSTKLGNVPFLWLEKICRNLVSVVPGTARQPRGYSIIQKCYDSHKSEVLLLANSVSPHKLLLH